MASAAPIYPREVIRNMNMFALKRKRPGVEERLGCFPHGPQALMPSREVGGDLGMELCLGPLLIGQALPNCPFIKVSDSTRVRASFLHHSFLPFLLLLSSPQMKAFLEDFFSIGRGLAFCFVSRFEKELSCLKH